MKRVQFPAVQCQLVHQRFSRVAQYLAHTHLQNIHADLHNRLLARVHLSQIYKICVLQLSEQRPRDG